VFYFFFKKEIENGYLKVPELNAERIFTIVVVIPNKTTAPVKKKFRPGKGKKSNKETIKYKFKEQ
jgi:hypothetical protein